MLLLGLAACARPPAAPDDWPERPWAANSGTFAVLQFATEDPDRVVAEWSGRSPGVKVDATHETRLGHPLTTFISFRQCKPDVRGDCRVTAEWQLVSPAGEVLLTTRSHVRVGEPALRPGAMGMSTEAPTFTVEAPDPPGRYLIRARTTDHVAGISLQTEDAIDVRP